MGRVITVDNEPLKTLARNLNRASPDIARALRRGVADAGRMIRDDARERASFSAKIPATIRVSASGTTATVKAGTAAVPEAALWERPGGWRHPTFGHRPWHHEGPHQYLHPALEAQREPATRRILDAVVEAIDSVLGGGDG